jgi:hypothetical protein
MHPDPIVKIAAMFVSSDLLVQRKYIFGLLMKTISPLFLSPLHLAD